MASLIVSLIATAAALMSVAGPAPVRAAELAEPYEQQELLLHTPSQGMTSEGDSR